MSAYAFWTAIWQGLLATLMAYGLFISFRVVKFPDLTCDGSYPLGASVAAVLISNGVNPFFATFSAAFAGCLAGIITGFFHTKFKIPGIVASILVMTSLYSINLVIMGKPIISIKKEDTIFAWLSNLQSSDSVLLFGVDVKNLILPALLLVLALCIKAIIDLLLSSNFGVAMRISGSNQRLAKSLAINTDVMTLIGLAIANGLIALSGALFAQVQRFSDVNLGFGMVVVGLASVFIAEGLETQLFKKRSIMIATTMVIFGSIFYKLAVALAYEAGLKTDYFNILTSSIVFLTLLVPSIRSEINHLIRK